MLRQLRDHIKYLNTKGNAHNDYLITNLKILYTHAEQMWNNFDKNIIYTPNPMFSPKLSPKYNN